MCTPEFDVNAPDIELAIEYKPSDGKSNTDEYWSKVIESAAGLANDIPLLPVTTVPALYTLVLIAPVVPDVGPLQGYKPTVNVRAGATSLTAIKETLILSLGVRPIAET